MDVTDDALLPTEIVCSRCGHLSLLTEKLKASMAQVERPIYRMVCSACGEKDAVYSRWPFYGLTGLTPPAVISEHYDEEDHPATPPTTHRHGTTTACMHQRTFFQLDDAQKFKAKVIEVSTSLVTLAPFDKGFTVSYSPANGVALANYRRGSRYREDESKFLVEAYLMWASPASLAKCVDRDEGTVSSWLAQRGFRNVPRDPHYARGDFPAEYALDLCAQICEGRLFDIQELVDAGIVPAVPAAVPGVSGPGYYPLHTMDASLLNCLLSFAIEHNAWEAASTICSLLGRNGQAYIFARQAENMPCALTGLQAMGTKHFLMTAARCVTEHSLRAKILDTVSSMLRSWYFHATERLADYQMVSPQLEISKAKLAASLRPILTPSLTKWPREIVDLMKCCQGKKLVLDDLGAECSRFGAWMSADMMRIEVGQSTQSGYGGVNTLQLERNISAFEAFLQGWEPDINALIEMISSWLSYDPALAAFVQANENGNLPILVQSGLATWAIPKTAIVE